MIDFIKQQRIVVFDLEVSHGFKRMGKSLIPTRERAKIIQIGLVVLENGKITNDVFESYVLPEPGFMIEDEVVEVTGIKSSDIKQGISEKEAIEILLEKCGDNKLFSALAGQNISGFDLPIINYKLNCEIKKDEGKDYSLPTSLYDSLVYARKLSNGKRQKNNNEALAERYGIDIEEVKKELTEITGKDYSNVELHTALLDSMVTAKIIEAMIEKSPEMFI